MQKGIDISKWQGDIDFAKVKKAGIDFVILRSSYRQTIDPKFFEYVEGCKKNDIPILGIYHFLYPLNERQSLEEAMFCVELAKRAGLNPDEIYIFSDFEYDSVKKALASGVTLGRTECNKFTRNFCEYVESQGYQAGIYSNIDYYKNWYDKELLEKYHYWLADYTGGPDYPCFIQQFTSSGRVDGINTKVDMNYLYSLARTSRQLLVDLALSWEGMNESDETFKYIIDVYNSYTGKFPRGVKMEYDWAWCACTWSALAIKLGYTNIIPIEISCGYLIEAAKKMGCWQENDNYVAQPGDAILYDWNDKTGSTSDNVSWPDHVGVIVETHEDAGYFVVLEGNYDNAVKKRTLSINGKYIRGFITPDYDENMVNPPAQSSGKDIKTIAHEVIAGVWGNSTARKNALEAAGYNYKEVQTMVNEILNGSTTKPVQNQTLTTQNKITATCAARQFDKNLAGTYKTTGNLYCRNDAGTNKKALCCIPKNTEVKCYGYYTVANNTNWLYIQFALDGVVYTGFSSSKYLSK